MITLARKSRTQRTPPLTAAIIEKLADAVFEVAEKYEINATEDKERRKALIVNRLPIKSGHWISELVWAKKTETLTFFVSFVTGGRVDGVPTKGKLCSFGCGCGGGCGGGCSGGGVLWSSAGRW